MQLREVTSPVRGRRDPGASNVVLSGPDTLRVNALGELEISRVELFDALQQRAIEGAVAMAHALPGRNAQYRPRSSQRHLLPGNIEFSIPLEIRLPAGMV